MKKPFKSTVDLDSVTVTCPCGASITGEGYEIQEFLKTHKEHTNGKLDETISDDGMRVFTQDSKRQRTIKI
jgi:hypothetical protein